jgi:hypothetical protein
MSVGVSGDFTVLQGKFTTFEQAYSLIKSNCFAPATKPDELFGEKPFKTLHMGQQDDPSSLKENCEMEMKLLRNIRHLEPSWRILNPLQPTLV